MAYRFLAENKDTPDTAPSKEYLIVVEGEDDGVFLEHVLSIKNADPAKVEIRYIKGISRIPEYLNALSKSPPLTSGMIKNIALIVDADDNFNKANGTANQWLREAGLPNSESGSVNRTGSVAVGVYLLPNSSGPGELEDLIISSLNGDPRVVAALRLLEAFKPESEEFKKLSKRVIQISLAVSNVSLCSGAGRGIRNGAFEINLDSVPDLSRFIDEFMASALHQ